MRVIVGFFVVALVPALLLGCKSKNSPTGPSGGVKTAVLSNLRVTSLGAYYPLCEPHVQLVEDAYDWLDVLEFDFQSNGAKILGNTVSNDEFPRSSFGGIRACPGVPCPALVPNGAPDAVCIVAGDERAGTVRISHHTYWTPTRTYRIAMFSGGPDFGTPNELTATVTRADGLFWSTTASILDVRVPNRYDDAELFGSAKAFTPNVLGHILEFRWQATDRSGQQTPPLIFELHPAGIFQRRYTEQRFGRFAAPVAGGPYTVTFTLTERDQSQVYYSESRTFSGIQ